MAVEDLIEILRQGEQAKSDVAMYEDDAARATALRGTDYATQNMVQGQGSYAGLLADAINRSRGATLAKETRPRLAESRERVGLAKARAQQYPLEQKEAEIAREEQRYTQEREDMLGKRRIVDAVRKEDKEPVMLFDDGRGTLYDGQGNPVDASLYEFYRKPPSTRSGGGGGGFKPSASERKNYRESKRLRGTLGALSEEKALMSPEAQEEIDSPVSQGVMSVLPTVGQRWAEEKAYDTPEAREYITRLNRVESKLSQLAAGLNVTGYEMKDRQKWSPNAPGISDEERQRRLNNVDRDLFGEVYLYEDMYAPEYHIEDFDERKALGLKDKKTETLLDAVDASDDDPYAGFSAEVVSD